MLDENIEELSSDEATENAQKEVEKEVKVKDDKVGEKKEESIKEEMKAVEKMSEEEANEKKVESEPNEVATKEEPIKEEMKAVEKMSEEEADEKKAESEPNEVATKEESVKEEVKAVEKKNEEEVDKKKTESEPIEAATKEEPIIKEEIKKIPVIDYAKMTLEELVTSIESLLSQFPVQDIKNQIETLKSDFIKKFKVFLAEKKEVFLKDGGNEIDFHYVSPVKNKFNDLLFEFKKKRQQFYREIENSQKQNLEKRLHLIEQLKDLIDKAEASTMYKNFRVLQDEWREAGQIPHTKYNDVWRTYHHHVERFYDLLHLNNDLRDLDFKHNLEEKTKLVEKAETLAEDKDVNHAFKELQILHKLWKEDIGPVAREFREDVWGRFSEATKKIHDKRHEFQDKIDAKLHDNVALKIAIIEKIKTINIDNITSHKLWQDNIKTLEAYRDAFFKAGRVPKSKNEEIWQLFKDATRDFNKSKNIFYKSLKHDQTENLTKKMHLVDQAESLKDSEDWDIATEVYKKIQSEWRKIGHVPRKDSDKIWKRFKDACNHYFDKLHDKQDGSNKEQTEIFNKKKDFLEQFKDLISQEVDLTLDMVNTHIKDWKALGMVPVKMRHIDSKFNKVIDIAYKKLNIDKDEAAFLKFKNNVDSSLEQNDVRKLDGEQLFVRRKIDELTKEIKQLENNISFISNASADNPLVKNVYKNIENYNKNLDVWKKKLSYLRKLEY